MTFDELQRRGNELTEAEYMAGQREVTRALRTALQQSREDLRGLYSNLSGVRPEDYFAEAVRTRGLQSTEAALIAHYQEAAGKVNQAVEQSSQIALSNSYLRTQYANTIAGEIVDVDITVPKLPPEVVNTSVFGEQALWANRFGAAADYIPKSGFALRELMRNHRAEDVRKIRRALIQGLTTGESYAQTARRLKLTLEITASDAIRIIRTEGHRNAMAGQFAARASAEEEGLKVRRQIDSTLDDRTRPQSVAVDNRRENDDGYFTYPGGVLVKIPGNSGVAGWDINDREAVIMVIDGVDPTVRRARDPRTGKTDIISWKRFDEWAESEGFTRNRYGQYI